MNIKPITFFAASDIVVIGSNPEMADFDNPRGHSWYCRVRDR